MHQDRDENNLGEQTDPERPAAEDEQGPVAETSEGPEVPGSDLAPIAQTPGMQVDRLTDVLLAADSAAAEILDAARAEAREFVAETQQSTIERAESLRRETDNLMVQTAELTARVVELTRATEQVMEGFRAELSLDAAEVREETVTAALPEPVPGPGPEPVDDLVSADEPAPEDLLVEPEIASLDEPEAELPGGRELGDADPATEIDEGEAQTELQPFPPETVGPEPDTAPPVGAPSATRESFAPPSVSPLSPSSPEPVAAEPEPEPEPQKRRGGLFGRFRRRDAAPEPDPLPSAATPAPAERAPAASGQAGPVTEGARLIARQMLATGLGEEEVKRQLREQFRLADPQAVLDSLRRNDRDDQSA